MALPVLLADWLPWLAAGAGAVIASTITAVVLQRRIEALTAEIEELRAAAAGAGGGAADSRPGGPSPLFHGTLESMEDGVVIADRAGRFVYLNPAAVRLVGREPGEAERGQGAATLDAFHPDRRTPLGTDEMILLKALRGEEPDPLEAYLRHDTGGVHVRGVARPIRGDAGEVIGGALVMRDITSRRAADEERETVVGDLRRQNKELERFTYTVSHELRSPLVTVTGFLGLLRRDVEAGDQERLSLDLDRIEEAVGTMSALLEDLLELSRSGVMISATSTVDLAEVVDEVLRHLQGPISESGASVERVDDLAHVHGDRSRLFEVFQNLIENALKFIGDQETPRVEIGARDDGGRVVCFVRDNGVGVPEADRERVFRVFERLDVNVDGTGVGLALVKGIVEAHGGEVWVEDGIDGVGSTFCFWLPNGQDETS